VAHWIETKRLLLRELTGEDCSPEYVRWLTDSEVSRYLETRHHPQDEVSVREFVERVNGRADEFLFGLFLRTTDRHIGNIKVGPIHDHHGLADISLLLGARDCWGQGYATEAIEAISRLAFERLGVRKLSASMYAPNAGSRAAFLKVGYRQEGTRRGHYELAGERCDVIELGLLPEDLAALAE
jgi:RimJ/RimL family protein N-acetyltransferase